MSRFVVNQSQPPRYSRWAEFGEDAMESESAQPLRGRGRPPQQQQWRPAAQLRPAAVGAPPAITTVRHRSYPQTTLTSFLSRSASSIDADTGDGGAVPSTKERLRLNIQPPQTIVIDGDGDEEEHATDEEGDEEDEAAHVAEAEDEGSFSVDGWRSRSPDQTRATTEQRVGTHLPSYLDDRDDDDDDDMEVQHVRSHRRQTNLPRSAFQSGYLVTEDSDEEAGAHPPENSSPRSVEELPPLPVRARSKATMLRASYTDESEEDDEEMKSPPAEAGEATKDDAEHETEEDLLRQATSNRYQPLPLTLVEPAAAAASAAASSSAATSSLVAAPLGNAQELGFHSLRNMQHHLPPRLPKATAGASTAPLDDIEPDDDDRAHECKAKRRQPIQTTLDRHATARPHTTATRASPRSAVMRQPNAGTVPRRATPMPQRQPTAGGWENQLPKLPAYSTTPSHQAQQHQQQQQQQQMCGVASKRAQHPTSPPCPAPKRSRYDYDQSSIASLDRDQDLAKARASSNDAAAAATSSRLQPPPPPPRQPVQPVQAHPPLPRNIRTYASRAAAADREAADRWNASTTRPAASALQQQQQQQQHPLGVVTVTTASAATLYPPVPPVPAARDFVPCAPQATRKPLPQLPPHSFNQPSVAPPSTTHSTTSPRSGLRRPARPSHAVHKSFLLHERLIVSENRHWLDAAEQTWKADDGQWVQTVEESSRRCLAHGPTKTRMNKKRRQMAAAMLTCMRHGPGYQHPRLSAMVFCQPAAPSAARNAHGGAGATEESEGAPMRRLSQYVVLGPITFDLTGLSEGTSSLSRSLFGRIRQQISVTELTRLITLIETEISVHPTYVMAYALVMIERVQLEIDYLSQPRAVRSLPTPPHAVRTSHRLALLLQQSMHSATAAGGAAAGSVDPARWLLHRYRLLRASVDRGLRALLMVCVMLTTKLLEDVPKPLKLFIDLCPAITREHYKALESAVLLVLDFDLVVPQAVVERKRDEIKQIF